MTWILEFTKQAEKDTRLIYRAGFGKAVKRLFYVLERNPFQNPPPYEKLTGDLRGRYSRRINLQHRLVYEVYKNEKIVRILTMWSHYE